MTTRKMTGPVLMALGVLSGIAVFHVVGQERSWIEVDNSVGSSRRESVFDRIEQTLEKRCDWKFEDVPLEDAMKQLSRRFGINIWIDREALSADGIGTDQQVTLVLSDAMLVSGLELILQPMQLTYLVSGEILKITTKVAAEEQMTSRVYPVKDLLDRIDDGSDDYETLISAIQDTTDGMWEDADGEGGAISPVDNAKSLVIRQTQKSHREIEGLLAALRKAKRVQNIVSIPTDHRDIESLRPVFPIDNRDRSLDQPARSRTRHSRPAASWQQPRVYSE